MELKQLKQPVRDGKRPSVSCVTEIVQIMMDNIFPFIFIFLFFFQLLMLIQSIPSRPLQLKVSTF